MSGTIRLFSGLLLATFTLAADATATGDRVSGTLPLTTTFSVKDTGVSCPAGSPQTADCYLFVGDAVVPGLGRVTERYTRMFDASDPNCVRTLPKATIEVAGKGEIDAAIAIPECVARPPIRLSFGYEISSGFGAYAGASGNIQVTSDVTTGSAHRDTWSGTLTVPSFDFDVTPPTVKGAVSKTVRARKNEKRVRVRYAVTAHDAVDGSIRVTCRPRSGAFFKLGRTTVSCTATDSSANTRRARFTIRVRR